MGSIVANHYVDGARGARVGHLDASSSLWGNAGRRLISAAGFSGSGHMESSAQDKSQRERSTLAKLFSVVDQANAAPMATALLNELGSLLRVLGASEEAVRRILGDDTCVYPLLQAVRESLAAATRAQVPDEPITPTDPRLIRYLCAALAPQRTEVLLVLFLDRQHRLMHDEVVSVGSLTTLTFAPRVVLSRALELGAAAVILVHNHPGGDPHPSKIDIEATNVLFRIGAALEVSLLDHIIVAGSKWCSMERAGFL